MARRILGVAKTGDMVDITQCYLPRSVLDAAQEVWQDSLAIGPNGEFVWYSCLFYSRDYQNVVSFFKDHGHTERYDVPCMGLMDVDIFTVLGEVLKRGDIEPSPVDFGEVANQYPDFALTILKTPEYLAMLRDAKAKNLPDNLDAEIQRLEEQLGLTEGKKGSKHQ